MQSRGETLTETLTRALQNLQGPLFFLTELFFIAKVLFGVKTTDKEGEMTTAHKGLLIGPSTGWLYANGIYSLSEQQSILEKAGANVVEVVFGGWEHDNKRSISLKAGEMFDVRSFTYRSLHLPVLDVQDQEHRLSVIKAIVACCGASVALTHPVKIGGEYPTGYYEQMIAGGIPLAIENMDSATDCGFKLEDLEMLVRGVGCRFVFDVHHAYERDQEMKYAIDLFELLKDKMTHLHVSGQSEDAGHSLVCKSRNAKTIVEFVGRVLSDKRVPLILEGEYSSCDELRQEIEFLKKELGC